MIGKIRQRWKLIAVILIASGIVLGIVGTVLGGTPVFSLSYHSNEGWRVTTIDDHVESVEYMEQMEAFDSLSVRVDYMDVYIEEGDTYALEYVSDKGDLVVTNKNGTLTVKEPSQMYMFSWGISTGFSGFSERYYVKVTVPEDAELKELKLVTDSGNIQIADIVAAGKLKAEIDSGSVEIRNAELAEVDVKTDAGNIGIEAIEAEKIQLKSGMGRITGTAVNTGRLAAVTDSGNVKIEELTTEEADLSTEFGDVILSLSEEEQNYAFDLDTDFGSVRLNGTKSSTRLEQKQTQGKPIKVVTDAGSIEVDTK